MEIEVTQADREAAKSLLGRDDAGPSWWSIDSGNADNDRLVQAFARHRATAFAAGRAARDREIVEWLLEDHGDWSTAARKFADAIERGGV